MPYFKKLLSSTLSLAKKFLHSLWHQAQETPARMERILKFICLFLSTAALLGAFLIGIHLALPGKQFRSLQKSSPHLPPLAVSDVYNPQGAIVRITKKRRRILMHRFRSG